MSKIAVLILTYNEAQNIKDCIDSVSFADEVVVIDSGSSDNTVELAETLGAKVVQREMKDGFSAQRNFALTQTTAEWVLFLDADERITEPLGQELQEVINYQGSYAYEIMRQNVAFGEPVQYGGHAPDPSLRFYPREAITWQGVVHEKAIVTLPVRRLKYPMLHHTYTSWERYFFKFNQYTTLMAEKINENGKRASFWDIVFRPGFAFFRDYVLKRGFLDGKMGFVLAGLHAFYTLVKYVKLYYLQKGRRESH